ncbi:MAG: right-handed parallel beta-helix repeat-containing protein, partial [Sedimentisphaerales bacterium]|nr:right-handed parallel beta-helix repeat-containing protein [Sedimentisphaerales bacterium]
QIEARIPVQSLPGTSSNLYLITQPGSYYLTGNIISNINDKGVIFIGSSNVTLDLNGFTISRSYLTSDSAVQANHNAISILAGMENITIKNGTIISDERASSNEYYRGFYYGISGYKETSPLTLPANITISNVTIKNAAKGGIQLYGNNHQVDNCVVSGSGYNGIMLENFGSVTNCKTKSNGKLSGYQSQYAGISCGESCNVLNNISTNNNGSGIKTDKKALVSENNTTSNQYAGITTGEYSAIKNNVASENRHGIVCTGYTKITDNTVCGNTEYGIVGHVTLLKNNMVINNISGSISVYSNSMQIDNMDD